MRFICVVSKAVTRTDHQSGLCTWVSTLAPSQACMTPSYLDFQSLLWLQWLSRLYTQLWLVRMGSFCSIWVQQNRQSQHFLSAKLTLNCSFKQKASMFSLLSVLVHFSRLLASSVPSGIYQPKSTENLLSCCSLDPEIPTVLPLSAFYIFLHIFHVYLLCAHMYHGVYSTWFFAFTTRGPSSVRSTFTS